MEDKARFENAEEEIFELNDEELENIAGGLDFPPAPPDLPDSKPPEPTPIIL